MRRSKPAWLLVLLLAVSLIAAACGGDDDDDGATDTTVAEDVPEGGTLVIGAEQEPDCTDWIGSCAGASWGFWTLNVTTMPRTFTIVDNAYEHTDLVTEEPELETEPVQKITYQLNPEAVWSDGTPITSKDFKYTWEQIANGEDIYDKSGYEEIESVDDSDPQTAVVTFKEDEVHADWKELFGGQYGILPAHLLEGKDRNAEMANGYTWSGGPWKIESWNKGVDATLIPNENYWGEKPKLDKVVFRFITDTAAEFQAFKAGETQMIYPQPQVDVVDQITAGLTGAESEYTAETSQLEALWFNNAKEPFNDEAVRKAWAYAIDRRAVVKRLFGGLGVEREVNTINAPIMERYATTDAWAEYQLDLDKVDETMTEAGYAKVDGVWAKGGRKLSIEMTTTAGNKRRELTEQIVQEQLRKAGFEVTIANQPAGDLIGEALPQGNFQVLLIASVLTSPFPSTCENFCISSIPTAENEFSGSNFWRVSNPEVDRLAKIVDSTLDEEERAEANKEADQLLADGVHVLPLDPLPHILIWNERVVGPIGHNPIMGPFVNLHQIGIRQ